MTTLPKKGEEIFGYKVMDQTTVSMLGARIRNSPMPAAVPESCI